MSQANSNDTAPAGDVVMQRLDVFQLLPIVSLQNIGGSGDWSNRPLGEILDGYKMRVSGFAAKCLKFSRQNEDWICEGCLSREKSEFIKTIC